MHTLSYTLIAIPAQPVNIRTKKDNHLAKNALKGTKTAKLSKTGVMHALLAVHIFQETMCQGVTYVQRANTTHKQHR
jgi:hypothetical protein